MVCEHGGRECVAQTVVPNVGLPSYTYHVSPSLSASAASVVGVVVGNDGPELEMFSAYLDRGPKKARVDGKDVRARRFRAQR